MSNHESPDQHVILARGRNQSEAILIVSALEADGIDCYFKNETLAGHLVGGSVCTVFVDKSKLDRAKEIWAALQEEAPAKADGVGNAKSKCPDSKTNRIIGWAQIAIFGIVAFNLGIHYETSKKKSSAPSDIKVDASGRRYRKFLPMGKSNVYIVQYFDSQSHLIEDRHSHSKEGPPYSISEFNPDGWIMRQLIDSNYDGKIDFWTEYNSDGFPVRREADLDFDGIADSVEKFDSRGLRESVVVRDKDKIIAEMTFKNGRHTESRIDLGRTGRFDTLIQSDHLGVARKITKIAEH